MFKLNNKKALLIKLAGILVITFIVLACSTVIRIFELKNPLMHGQDILNLQNRLLSLGFSEIGDADGYYGPLTEVVIKQIQTFSGFEPDGKVNKTLLDIIFNDNNASLLRNISIVSAYDPNSLEKTENLFGSGFGEWGQKGFVYYSKTDRKAKIFEYYSGDESMKGSIMCYFISDDNYFLISDTEIYGPGGGSSPSDHFLSVNLVSNNIFIITNGVLEPGSISGGWDSESIINRINDVKNKFYIRK